ncbi:hypothetical protein Taro_021840 [Colocasia esculenta]|uniref:Uncharacterized protein n=1 Tax=Colocasia esculenta TaxID=4460 RepID=A0A843V6L6_COLES|nr:hypothetical protein [Colocasia esculenta]
MLSVPTMKACTCLPPALFRGMAQFVTVFASGLVVWGGRSGDLLARCSESLLFLEHSALDALSEFSRILQALCSPDHLRVGLNIKWRQLGDICGFEPVEEFLRLHPLSANQMIGVASQSGELFNGLPPCTGIPFKLECGKVCGSAESGWIQVAEIPVQFTSSSVVIVVIVGSSRLKIGKGSKFVAALAEGDVAVVVAVASISVAAMLATLTVMPRQFSSRINREGMTNVVQPARRLRTCAKAKKTYGGLDKDSLAQSGVFSVERWSMSREKCVKTDLSCLECSKAEGKR